MPEKDTKFSPPTCPDCGQPLDSVAWDESSTYIFNPETGRYDEYDGVGYTKCINCGANVYDEIPDGPVNYQSKEEEEIEENPTAKES